DGGKTFVFAQQLDQSVFAELFALRVRRFGYSVGHQDEAITGLESGAALRVESVGENTQHGSAFRQAGDRAILPNQNGRHVACVRVVKRAARRIQNTVEQRRE